MEKRRIRRPHRQAMENGWKAHPDDGCNNNESIQ